MGGATEVIRVVGKYVSSPQLDLLLSGFDFDAANFNDPGTDFIPLSDFVDAAISVLRLDFDGLGNSITLLGITASDISADDFLFG